MQGWSSRSLLPCAPHAELDVDVPNSVRYGQALQRALRHFDWEGQSVVADLH